MNVGTPMESIAQRVKGMESQKLDLIAPARAIRMVGYQEPEKAPAFPVFEIGTSKKIKFDITPRGMDMVAEHCGIPMPYLRKMQAERPALVAENINGWLEKQNSRHLVRALKAPNHLRGTIRAMLSDRYRPLDNWDLLQVAMPVVHDLGLTIRSADLTDTHLYIKATMPKMQAEVKVGDVVEAGVEIRNSEIGMSSVSLSWLVFRLSCLNGAVHQQAQKSYHVGKRTGDVDSPNVERLLRDETRLAEDKAFWMRFRDVLAGAFNRVEFEKLVNKLRSAAEQKIVGDVAAVVEVTRKKFLLSEETGAQILDNLIRGKDLTRYGLSNAVTFTANGLKDYDESTKLEGIGGDIIELPQSAWATISASKAA